jgi:hypothetical protein
MKLVQNRFVAVMYNNDEMSEKAKILARKVKRRIHRQPYHEVTEITPLFTREKLTNDKTFLKLSEPSVKLVDSTNDDGTTSPWKIPPESNVLLFLLRWPITFTLWCSIPNSRRFKSFYILSFINCVIWIGLCSYFIVFVSTDVGKWRITILLRLLMDFLQDAIRKSIEQPSDDFLSSSR